MVVVDLVGDPPSVVDAQQQRLVRRGGSQQRDRGVQDPRAVGDRRLLERQGAAHRRAGGFALSEPEWHDARTKMPPNDHRPIQVKFGNDPVSVLTSGRTMHRVREAFGVPPIPVWWRKHNPQ